MAFTLVVTAVGCAEQMPELQEELDLTRCLIPTELSAKVSQGQIVQFNWTKSKGATYFVLELYSDESMTSLAESFEIQANELPYTVDLGADNTFYARVQAVDANGILDSSKWAEFEDPIVTTAVKSNLYLEFTDKTSSSVTVKWEADPELERIEWAAGEVVEKRNLTAEEISAGQAVITGLNPSTSYNVSIWFKSANRGEVVALTGPNTDGYTEVADLASFQSALASGAPKIYVRLAGSPYEITGTCELKAGVEILGEQSVDGSRPVLNGEFHIADGYDGKAIHIEAVELNGCSETYGFVIQLKNGGAEDKTVESIVFKNCVITGYSKGLFYEWGKKITTNRIAWDGCTIYDINKSFENGGDGIDFRNASDIKSLEVINNTIYNGFRTFLRLDAALVVTNLKVENNTFMNVSYNAGNANTNNSGLMGIKCVPAAATFANNLLVNMPDGCGISRKAGANLAPADMNMTFSNNHYYNVGASFFSDTDGADQNNRVSQAVAIGGGGSVLSADPCYNAKGGVFNLTNPDLVAAKVGAPQWQVTFVEKPEDLTLGVLDGPHTWNFADAKYFSGTVEKHKVRDFLYMGAVDNKLNIADGAINFTAETPTKKGVPTDGYVAFKVNKPGSVYINAVDPDGLGNHLVIATGPVDGSSATVKGGAVASAHNQTNQKILISDIVEETMVYVYASGPIGLSQLAWALDLTQVNTALPTPEPEVDPAKVDQGASAEAVVTWAPVDNAGSYSVVFSGKTYAVEEGTSFVISADVIKFLDAGSYKIEVYANPAEGDIYNTQSSAGVAVLTIAAKAAPGESNEFVVSSVDDLVNAISSGKTDITLAYSSTPYEIGQLTITNPLRLKGQVENGAYTPLSNASFKLSGQTVGTLILENFEFIGRGEDGAVIVEDKTNPILADTVAVFNSVIRDYKARLYDNSGKAASCVQYLIFNGVQIDNCSDGNDFIDLRAGHYHNLRIFNSTFANSARTFIRTDAGSEINYVTVLNNTFYKLCTNSTSKDNNGLFHIRSAAGSGMIGYRIQNNIFYSILIDQDPENAAGYPRFISKNSAALKPDVMTNNYFYNIEEREEKAAYSWWTVNCSREEGTAGGGVVLTADPFKDAAAGDYTLVNAVAMNANVGDPRWNPMRGSNPSSEITVENVTDLLTAISAGKKTITLKKGVYDFTALTDVAEVSNGVLTLSGSLNLIGEEGAELIGGFKPSNAEVENISLSGLKLNGNSSIGNMLEIGSGDVAIKTISLKNSTITNYKNRMFYFSQTDASVSSFVMLGCHVENMGTSGDFFDVRKGTMSAVRFTNNTFANGIRTFMRMDASVVCGSISVTNNTFYNLGYVDSKDNNGIFHVRSTSVAPENFSVARNLFASMHQAEAAPSQANGYPKLVSTNSANIIPTFRANYYYDIQSDEAADFCWWTKGRITAADGLANYGVLLNENPFADAANSDFTLVNALAISESIGDQKWNPNKGQRPDDWFTVTSVEELLTAISAGKQNISLAYGTYDLTSETLVNDAVANGKLALVASLNIKGATKDGLRPEFIGGFQLTGTDVDFTASNIRFNGNKSVDNFVYVADGATVTGVNLLNNEITSYKNRLFYQDKDTSVTYVMNLLGNLIYDMGTSGDCVDIRKGTLKLINIKNNTLYNGIRTFIRCDADVVCGAVTVENNTFFNLCSADSKDNNGIFHVRTKSVPEDAFLVKRNIFASMHKIEGAPSDANANGFPKLLSTNSASKVPVFAENYFYDVETADAATSWFTPGKRASQETPMTEADIVAAATAQGGAILTESPFAGDTASGKFTVTVNYKGYGDLRW